MSDKATSKDRFLKEKRTKINKDNIKKGPKASVRPDERGPEKIRKRGNKFKRDGVEFDKPLGPKGTFNTGNPPVRFEVSKGGRIGLKAGSKGCKLAMKGKGKAYGKNS